MGHRQTLRRWQIRFFDLWGGVQANRLGVCRSESRANGVAADSLSRQTPLKRGLARNRNRVVDPTDEANGNNPRLLHLRSCRSADQPHRIVRVLCTAVWDLATANGSGAHGVSVPVKISTMITKPRITR